MAENKVVEIEKAYEVLSDERKMVLHKIKEKIIAFGVTEREKVELIKLLSLDIELSDHMKLITGAVDQILEERSVDKKYELTDEESQEYFSMIDRANNISRHREEEEISSKLLNPGD